MSPPLKALTPWQEREMRALYLNTPRQELADRYGVHVNTLRRMAIDMGIVGKGERPRNGGYRSWHERELELLQQWHGKMPRKEIARRLGRTERGVQGALDYLKRRKLPAPPPPPGPSVRVIAERHSSRGESRVSSTWMRPGGAPC
jgi:hypothetical protein